MASGTAVDREVGDLVGADRTLQEAVELLQHHPAQVSQGDEVWHGGQLESLRFLFDGEELLL